MAISKKLKARIAENEKRVKLISNSFPHALNGEHINQVTASAPLSVAK